MKVVTENMRHHTLTIEKLHGRPGSLLGLAGSSATRLAQVSQKRACPPT